VRSQIHRGLERLRRLLPGGSAAFSGMAFAPAGPAGPAALVRGLDALRGEVLRAAGHSSTAAAAVSAVALQATLGALIVSKTTLFTGAAVLVAGLGLWSVRGDGEVSRVAPVDVGGATPVASAPARAEDAYPSGDALAAADAAGSRAPAAGSTEEAHDAAAVDPIAAWLARFDEAPDDWRHGWAVAAEIAELPPDEALAIMTGVWPHLSVPVKEQALKPFLFHGGHPHALPILHLAATDASLSVQARAFTYLQSYAFRDFANDYAAYLAWSERWRGAPVADVLAANARELANDLLTLAPAQLSARLKELDGLDLESGGPAGVDLARVLRDAGALQGLATALGLGDAELARTALRWSKTMHADESWLRAHVVPAIEVLGAAGGREISGYLDALGRPDCGWAHGVLLGHLERLAAAEPGDPEATPAGAFAAARALADVGDPAAIPALIDVLARDRSGQLGYAIGHFGLAELTGVRWQESHDAAWWLDWWERNRGRMPAAIGGAAPGLDD
jgi:hypothetical protein